MESAHVSYERFHASSRVDTGAKRNSEIIFCLKLHLINVGLHIHWNANDSVILL